MIPDHWTPEWMSESFREDVLEDAIEQCDYNIKKLTTLRNSAMNRLQDLKARGVHKYILRLFYVEPYTSDYHERMEYYGIVVLDYVVIDNKCSEPKLIKSDKYGLYEHLYPDIGKYKTYMKDHYGENYFFIDDIQDDKKWSYGDL